MLEVQLSRHSGLGVMEEKELMVREGWQMEPPAQADDDNRGFAGWSQVLYPK